jgi:hypothetical protein
MICAAVNVIADEYWFGFYESDPATEVKSFSKPDGEWTELSRDTSNGRVIIMKVSAVEFAAGFNALSNARKLQGVQAANEKGANFSDWTDTEKATAKVFSDKHEAMKEIMYSLLANNATLRQIVFDNTQYTNAATLGAVLDPTSYADMQDEIRAKMNE